jgi:hypothetical protein
MENNLSANPGSLIFLIGAARSGTKIVRDVLSSHPDINCVPYDINFIWRTGNEGLLNDQLTPDDYKIKSHKRIDSYLKKYKNGAPYLIEKTVSNTIRIPFLLKHYPHAKFIFLYRNGMDVCESVMRQWDTSNDKKYILRKLKHVPLKELISYGTKFVFRNWVRRKDRFFWGVHYPDLDKDLSDKSIEMIVARQWQYCVDRMLADRSIINDNALLEIGYEDFVLRPNETINNILNFIDPNLKMEKINMTNIKSGNIGKSASLLSNSQKEVIASIISQTMSQLNYK